MTIATNMAGRGTDIKLEAGVVYANCKVPPTSADARRTGRTSRWPVPARHRPSAASTARSTTRRPTAPTASSPSSTATSRDWAGRICRSNVPVRPAHRRHRAARGPAHRQPASRAVRPPGRPRLQPLLPVAARTTCCALRRRVDAQDAGAGWASPRASAIEDKRITKGIERAQKKVEERNFDIRKNLLEYDEVMDYQRRAFYTRAAADPRRPAARAT